MSLNTIIVAVLMIGTGLLLWLQRRHLQRQFLRPYMTPSWLLIIYPTETPSSPPTVLAMYQYQGPQKKVSVDLAERLAHELRDCKQDMYRFPNRLNRSGPVLKHRPPFSSSSKKIGQAA